jgi:hypothetical protein
MEPYVVVGHETVQVLALYQVQCSFVLRNQLSTCRCIAVQITTRVSEPFTITYSVEDMASRI